MALHTTITKTTRKEERMWKATHLSIGHNTKDTNTNPYQPGGVAIMSCNKVVHQISGSGKDPTGLGRFCWTTYQGKNNLTVRIVMGYRPCNTENGHLLVLQQHWRYQDQTQQEHTKHPCKAFWTDLKPLLQEWTMQGDHIILGINANKDIQNPEITAFFDEFGMSKVILAMDKMHPRLKTMDETPLMEFSLPKRSKTTHAGTSVASTPSGTTVVCGLTYQKATYLGPPHQQSSRPN